MEIHDSRPVDYRWHIMMMMSDDEYTTNHEYCIMGLLLFIGLISIATSTGVIALTVVSWKHSQRVGVVEKQSQWRLQWRQVCIPA